MRVRELIELLNQVPGGLEIYVRSGKPPGEVELGHAELVTVWTGKDESKSVLLVTRVG